jgi:hypothetical protein
MARHTSDHGGDYGSLRPSRARRTFAGNTTAGVFATQAQAVLLIITDVGFKPGLTIRRDHAFLLAPGGRMTMRASKPVFRMA